MLLFGLAGCGAQSGPSPVAPAPTLPMVREALASQAGGAFEAIGYLYRTPAGDSLIGALSLGAPGSAVPLADGGQIWLAQPPALPADSTPEAVGGASYIIVRARGQLAPPGAYGPAGAYRYQLSQASLKPLSVRDLTIPLLLSNAPIYSNQPVRISGQLLLSQKTALLIERIGSGGVPDSSALQIKLSGPIDSAALSAQLTAAGDARFGPVQVIGIWRNGALAPLLIRPT
jgi:hypothetical protein